MILSRFKKKIQEVAYQECFKMKDQEILIIKEGIIYIYIVISKKLCK